VTLCPWRADVPSLMNAAIAVKSCYRPDQDDHVVVYLGSSYPRHAGQRYRCGRLNFPHRAPAESQIRIQDCFAAFKAEKLPTSVRAPMGEVFAEYDDLYLKEIPLALGPKSIEHMLALRKSSGKIQSNPIVRPGPPIRLPEPT
jgi:hypothetical protein